MLVKEVIQGMEAGTITGKQLSEQYAISTRTISKKIKQLGYLYDNTNKTYTYTGDDLETAENTDFGALFRQNIRLYADITPPVPKPIKQITDKPKPTASKPKPKKEPAPALDAIDKLLMPVKDKPKRIYRGYYFDADLLNIIDASPNKSALINECIRAVFKQKGLL